MKKTLFLLIIGLIVYSCKNKDEDPQPAQDVQTEVKWYDTLEWCTPEPPAGYIAFCTMESAEFTPYSIDYESWEKKDELTIYKACDYYYIYIPGKAEGDSIECWFHYNNSTRGFAKFHKSQPYALNRTYNSVF